MLNCSSATQLFKIISQALMDTIAKCSRSAIASSVSFKQLQMNSLFCFIPLQILYTAAHGAHGMPAQYPTSALPVPLADLRLHPPFHHAVPKSSHPECPHESRNRKSGCCYPSSLNTRVDSDHPPYQKLFDS